MNPVAKIVVVGDSGVGKTSLVNWYMYQNSDPRIEPTIGAAFFVKDVEIIDSKAQITKKVKLQIWDTAGQERYRSIVKIYYRNATGCVCVFDITNRNSFTNLAYWIRSYREAVGDQGKNIIVLANKCDLPSDMWAISKAELETFSNGESCSYFLTTSRTGHNINLAMELLAESCLKTANWQCIYDRERLNNAIVTETTATDCSC